MILADFDPRAGDAELRKEIVRLKALCKANKVDFTLGPDGAAKGPPSKVDYPSLNAALS